MEFDQTILPGCFEIRPNIFRDNRGSFIKTYLEETFNEKGLCTNCREEYYSVSKRGVIRGMHFQTPPMQHTKMVYCLQGIVQDVLLDLRIGSPSFGSCCSIELSAEKGNIIYIPEGIAHGFCALTDMAIMQYKVSSIYSPEHDSGILWSSIPLDWNCSTPIISPRDANLIALESFKSPFKFETARI